MLKLLHLSDLHFITDDKDTQYDRDNEIRDALLADLGGEERVDFNAVLVTGDIAYHGRADEFNRAGQWFDAVLKKANVPSESLFAVPGNHDVNQEHVARGSIMWDAHVAIRAQRDAAQRDLDLEKKLKDQSWDLLRPLTEYRNFAAERGRLSVTSARELAWVSQLTATINETTPVKLHGLNSAFLSDAGDTKANLLVSPFQFRRLAVAFDGVNIVMCHHPPSWLIDGNDVENRLRRHAHVVLTGHEHLSRCYSIDNCLYICAGAVHPSRGEAEWNPGYNIVHLSVEAGSNRTLLTRVETRIWHKTEFCFINSPYSDASKFFEHRQSLPSVETGKAPQEQPATLAPPPTGGLKDVENTRDTAQEAARAAARRKLIIHFFRLGTIARYNVAMAAGVWEEGDDAFEGQARWARVFDRAERTAKIHALWNCVAVHDETLRNLPNPFTPKT